MYKLACSRWENVRETRQKDDNCEVVTVPTKPEKAVSTPARRNRMKTVGVDKAPTRAPTRLACGVATGAPIEPAEARAATADGAPHPPQRGRGALTNASGRFEKENRSQEDYGWGLPEDLPPLRTQVTRESAKTIITRNDSPDIPFARSINPYRGCEHGCVYCFARSTHAYLGMSPGLDFETRLFAKTNAASLLERELSVPGYAAKTIAIGTNTDPYQPIERKERVMRKVLEVLARTNHPVAIVTKSALVLRDLDLLAPMTQKGLVKVALSVTTLDPCLARKMEPRASSPERRLDAIRRLAEANIPTAVMVAPIIPAVNDAEIEAILARAQAMGAHDADYVLLRLPLEVRDTFCRMAARALSGQAQARAVLDACIARGQTLRFEVWRADDRVWPLRLDDWAQVRGGGGTAWTWTKPRGVAVRSVPASGARGRTIALVLRGCASAAF